MERLGGEAGLTGTGCGSKVCAAEGVWEMEAEVATYVVLASLTDQGARTMQDLPQRLQNARATFAAMGATPKQIYFAMGQYDYVIIAEAPDDETMTRVSLAVSGQGNVRTNTFRVFTEHEALALVEGAP
jgi:uncharacterized protein with GYD domain